MPDLTLQEAAEELGVSASTLRWQVRNKKLKATKVGPVWTVTRREVERYRRESRRKARCAVHHPDLGQCLEPAGHESWTAKEPHRYA